MQVPGCRRSARGALLIAVALVSSSCAGYRIGATKPAELLSVERVAIPTFRNLTLEPRSSVLMTNMVIKQFQRDGSYQISSEENADAVLRGTIIEMERRQLRSAKFNTLRSREINLTIRVEYELEELATGIILARGMSQGDTNIFLDPNFQLSERQAIEDASREVAERIVTRVSEGW
jgi:hypothetical protein